MEINLLILSAGNSRLAVGAFVAGQLEHATRLPNDDRARWADAIKDAWGIVRSRDDSQVESIMSVAAFPDAVWSEKSRAECDYLFCPAESSQPSI